MRKPTFRREYDSTTDDTPAFSITDESWIEGVWTMDQWGANYANDHEDRCGDGSPRIVKTVPCEAMIRVSLMAMLYRARPDESLTFTMRFRYWGSDEPQGTDDYLTCHHWGVPDPETAADLAEFIEDTTGRLRAMTDASQMVTEDELRYTPVQGNASKLLDLVSGMGIRCDTESDGGVTGNDDGQPDISTDQHD